LKAIELVLKKNDKHGESVALKGAILGRLATTDEEKKEAIDVCKRGVQLDLASKNSWAHLARLYQANLKYEDAVRAYKMALKACKPVHVAEKQDFRRNLMIMLAQLRSWSELADLRRQVQIEHPDQPIHWVGYRYVG
jgi:hypothetical protein